MTTQTEIKKTPLYITDAEVMETLDISQPTLWRWTKKRDFPKPVMRGRRSYKAFMKWMEGKGLV
ncbi:helix-turn-helix transcriptional regulator [Aliivibrio fischeri]|uniref:helix-turn-helix transcriptional regulator n=1 Tax=Aliivibrio fischeri TaxID=668 RepID=UPI00080DA91C|nr:AlpA family phage regulatory protein [Aliivibrio fischeri]OCH06543.1 hypothetical protein A6E11_17235 [Aliivibrio fischeri]